MSTDARLRRLLVAGAAAVSVSCAPVATATPAAGPHAAAVVAQESSETPAPRQDEQGRESGSTAWVWLVVGAAVVAVAGVVGGLATVRRARR